MTLLFKIVYMEKLTNSDRLIGYTNLVEWARYWCLAQDIYKRYQTNANSV